MTTPREDRWRLFTGCELGDIRGALSRAIADLGREQGATEQELLVQVEIEIDRRDEELGLFERQPTT